MFLFPLDLIGDDLFDYKSAYIFFSGDVYKLQFCTCCVSQTK